MIDKKTLRRIFLGVVGCIVLYWILHETDRVNAVFRTIWHMLSPFGVGAVLAFIFNVPMRRFERLLSKIPKKGIRRTLAIVLTLASVVLVLTIVIQLLIPQLEQTIQSFMSRLPVFFADAHSKIQNFLSENPKLLTLITENTDWEQLDVAGLIQKAVDMFTSSVSAILAGMFAAIGGFASAMFNLIISIVFCLYCLARKEVLARQGRRLIYAFTPERVGDEIIRILRMANCTFSNFLSGQFLEVCILGCLFAVTMLILGMPYVPLVSMLVAVTAFIPLVGAFVGCFLGALFILVDNPVQAAWFVVMFLALQQIEGNLIYPRVVGTSIGLPGMWVLVAVAVGGELLGVAGMFLMIPLASVLYTLLGEVTAKRLAARKIDEEKLTEHPPEIMSKFKQRRIRKKKRKETENASKAQTDS